jgi:hypothetical protein
MNICYYCQDNIDPKEDFLIVQPDKVEIHVCSECMGDIIKFFKSGEAENKKIESLAPEHPETVEGLLGIDMKRHCLCTITKDGRVGMLFRNSTIHNMQMNRKPYYSSALMPPNGPYSPLTNPYNVVESEIRMDVSINDMAGKILIY